MHREYFDNINFIQKQNNIKPTRLQNKIIRMLKKLRKNVAREQTILSLLSEGCDRKMVERFFLRISKIKRKEG